jgi:pimeloyl-ACP methyl ester carboxylesterase
MPHATATDGTRIHYRQAGDEGPWVVFIQGLSLSGRFWFEIPERVAREQKVRALWLDNRGTGESGRARRPFSMRTLARDVVSVMDDAGAPRATVVGISMGGMIAQHVVVRHPERVEGLVLMATTPGLPHGRLPAARTLAALAQAPFRRGRAAERIAAYLLMSPKNRHRYGELFAHWPAAFAADPQRPATFFLQLGAIALHSTGRALRRVSVPTVVVTGSDDVLVSPVNSRRIAKLVPGAQLEVVPDIGHAIPAQDPRAVDRAIERVRGRMAAG